MYLSQLIHAVGYSRTHRVSEGNHNVTAMGACGRVLFNVSYTPSLGLTAAIRQLFPGVVTG